MKDYQDAYGHNMYDYIKGKSSGFEIVERDDGLIDVTGSIKRYFSEYKDWPSQQNKAMEYVKGKVLDIGCGAGRHSLYLQEKGFDVLGIDFSPLAVKVCKLRGLKKAKVIPITQINSKLGIFDTILMLGGNFGLFGNFKSAIWLLKRFNKITSGTGRIIAETRDPYYTELPEHLEYHEFNRKRGRMSGQVRIRIRYKKYVTPWFDYLLFSKEEMNKILKNTDWEVKKFINGQYGMYIAIIEKRLKTERIVT